ncbi:MAG TPA: hypothetical protein VFB60_24100 [Ktedonobacteraceae bacterium]|nr:hypothetical protein [Ktedonobacteraceae bacterium]
MMGPIDLEKVLSASDGKVHRRKLEMLKQKLEDALGGSLSTQVVDDPMFIRFRLVEYMRSQGTSSGVMQSVEQLFMGVVRRAAVEGLLPAPPEGPWTRLWQAALDASKEHKVSKAMLRSLASWSTARNLSPLEIEMKHLIMWSDDLKISKKELSFIEQFLKRLSSLPKSAVLPSDTFLMDRLRKKALQGSVNTKKHFQVNDRIDGV